MTEKNSIDGNSWITLETMPPSSQADFERLARALDEAQITIEVEENAVRQCERDPAAWLHVLSRDLPLALEVKRRLLGE